MRFAAYDFFSGRVPYADLTLAQKVACSAAVVSRVWWILHETYIPLSIFAVCVGGWMGWEGEFWSPWGWPPILGGFKEIWLHPGLSTVWSRVRQAQSCPTAGS
jgi:hypothetical protein